jgi:hypothetical protein
MAEFQQYRRCYEDMLGVADGDNVPATPEFVAVRVGEGIE